MDEAQKILLSWKAKKRHAQKKADNAATLAELDNMTTEQVALIALAAVLKINDIRTDEPLFSHHQSPTERAISTLERFGEPEQDGQSAEINKCWIETYKAEHLFAIDKRTDGNRKDHAELIFGVDPCELTDDQWKAREKLASKIANDGHRNARYNAEKLLAMQGDRLEFAQPENY
jgi:hypothetical protein